MYISFHLPGYVKDCSSLPDDTLENLDKDGSDAHLMILLPTENNLEIFKLISNLFHFSEAYAFA